MFSFLCQGATVGVVVGSGSRDESSSQSGASLHLEGMAYKLTEERSSIRLMRCVQSLPVASHQGNIKFLFYPEQARENLTGIYGYYISQRHGWPGGIRPLCWSGSSRMKAPKLVDTFPCACFPFRVFCWATSFVARRGPYGDQTGHLTTGGTISEQRS